ncbi:hypothetical protein KC19_3G105500 [Ceratodon purpureus]|uniref:Ycf20-like protein n=1 Tax=Ceratodon purpureus TaxID=3225 RepID=A0A8T0IJ50_CERPU|nr:hypothetical protein KC19_3G105500 [Ceratodon purpureus]
MSTMVGAWLLPTSTSMVARPRRVASRECCEALPRSLFTSTHQQRGFSRHEVATKRRSWSRRVVITGTLSTSGSPGGEPGEPVGGLGSTRLGRLISVRRRELLQRWNTVRRNFPSKIFLLLFGFFSANALATILGQTGDWDVIAAGILVAIIEGVGHLMYNRMPAFLGSRGKATIELVNYWKIGFTFALFVDAFKVGS